MAELFIHVQFVGFLRNLFENVLPKEIELSRNGRCYRLWINSQENTCVFNLFFNKFTGVFLWILRKFEEHLFLQNTSGGCFWRNLRLRLRLSKTKNYEWFINVEIIANCSNSWPHFYYLRNYQNKNCLETQAILSYSATLK